MASRRRGFFFIEMGLLSRAIDRNRSKLGTNSTGGRTLLRLCYCPGNFRPDEMLEQHVHLQ